LVASLFDHPVLRYLNIFVTCIQTATDSCLIIAAYSK
jgi:hypothetical protein